jgi:hypothetical protein
MDARAALLILLTCCPALGLIAYSPLRTANGDCVPIQLCRRFAGTGSIGQALLDKLTSLSLRYVSYCCDFIRHEIQAPLKIWRSL